MTNCSVVFVLCGEIPSVLLRPFWATVVLCMVLNAIYRLSNDLASATPVSVDSEENPFSKTFRPSEQLVL